MSLFPQAAKADLVSFIETIQTKEYRGTLGDEWSLPVQQPLGRGVGGCARQWHCNADCSLSQPKPGSRRRARRAVGARPRRVLDRQSASRQLTLEQAYCVAVDLRVVRGNLQVTGKQYFS